MRLRIALLAVMISVGLVGTANGQIVTQWNFPTGFSLTNPVPSIGGGTASLIGGITASSASGTASSGSTEPTGTNAAAWNTTTYPGASVGSGTAGVQFLASTASQSDILVRFDLRNSNTSSRYMRLEYTIDGTSWINGGVFDSNVAGDTWYNNRTVDLSGVSAVNNNVNFGVRMVSIFDPANNSSYTATQSGSAYATGGTMRYDAVTISAGSVWVGGSGTELGTAANYAGGAAPTTTGTVLLGTAGGANTTVATTSGGTAVDQLVFRSGAPSYTLSGTGTLTAAAGIVNNSTATHAISAPVTFGNQNSIFNAGTLNLTGPVAFTNNLVLQGGVTNFGGTVSGTGSLRVASGTLGGTGTISSAVTVYSGGTIRGGSGTSTDTLTVGNTTVNSGGQIAANLAASGTNSSLALGSNTLNLITGSKLTLTGVSGFSTTAPGTYILASLTNAGGTSLQLDGTGRADGFIFGTYVQGAGATGPITIDVASLGVTLQPEDTFVLSRSGTNLVLNFSPVPEPGSILAIGAGVMGVGAFVRRKLRKKTATEPVAVAA